MSEKTEFEKAFASARKAGKKTFTFNGKEYNTKLKKTAKDLSLMERVEKFKKKNDGMGPGPGNEEFWLKDKKKKKKKMGGFKEESFLEPPMPKIFDDYNG